MQRTYLALSALSCGAALVALAALPLQANTAPSRAPLAQRRATASLRTPEPTTAGRAPAAAAVFTMAAPLMPPPLPDDTAQIVALEVIPYTP